MGPPSSRICLKREPRGISRPYLVRGKARFLASRTSAPACYSEEPHPWMHGEADDRKWDPAISVPGHNSRSQRVYAGFVLEAEPAGSVGRYFSRTPVTQRCNTPGSVSARYEVYVLHVIWDEGPYEVVTRQHLCPFPITVRFAAGSGGRGAPKTRAFIRRPVGVKLRVWVWVRVRACRQWALVGMTLVSRILPSSHPNLVARALEPVCQ